MQQNVYEHMTDNKVIDLLKQQKTYFVSPIF